MNDLMFPLGMLFLGIIMGLLFYREILNWLRGHSDINRGSCAICSAKGFVSPCSRCRKEVAMCHSYYIRLTGDPDPYKMTGRPSTWFLCTECSSTEEKEFFEKKGKVVCRGNAS